MSAEHLRLLLRSVNVFLLIGVNDAIKWNALISPAADIADFRWWIGQELEHLFL